MQMFSNDFGILQAKYYVSDSYTSDHIDATENMPKNLNLRTEISVYILIYIPTEGNQILWIA